MTHIALLDCNNFFVSCERLFRPDLRERPVVVLSSNDGCVVARSKEIKDKGIPMGVPYFQIKDTLNEMEAVVFSSHFALYRDVSRRVFEVVRSEYKTIEQYSIDECFISFESDDPVAEMRELKRRVEQEVGIPVSIGIATSKTQAKYASTVAKKTDGVAWLPKEAFALVLPAIKLGEIWGVGRGRSAQFLKDGLRTAADFLAVPESVVAKRYGLEGRRLREELLGHVAHKLVLRRPAQKSIMSTRSFATASTDAAVVKDALLYHLHQVVADLQTMDLEAGVIRVVIAPSRHGAYALSAVSKEAVLSESTADIFLLQKVVADLFLSIYTPDIPYKKAGIMAGGLVSPRARTASLFGESAANEKTSALTSAMMAVNKSLGADVMQVGRLPAKSPAWSVKRGLLSPAYTTSWKDLKTVYAKP